MPIDNKKKAGKGCACEPKTPLCEATWTGARYDEHTKFPEGFNPKSHGLVFVKGTA